MWLDLEKELHVQQGKVVARSIRNKKKCQLEHKNYYAAFWNFYYT